IQLPQPNLSSVVIASFCHNPQAVAKGLPVKTQFSQPNSKAQSFDWAFLYLPDFSNTLSIVVKALCCSENA
ncbi:hypothetical protein, partial [Enterovibrio norvegicus]|uniref:hypothetical protein n=1 Tax=Enterovibrio norvegicus TaxID=188144 RepID=UPI001A7E18FC